MAPTKEDYEELQNKTPFAEIFTDPSSEGFKNSLKAFALLSDPTRVPAVVVRPRSEYGFTADAVKVSWEIFRRKNRISPLTLQRHHQSSFRLTTSRNMYALLHAQESCCDILHANYFHSV
jgi:hypothetical protein